MSVTDKRDKRRKALGDLTNEAAAGPLRRRPRPDTAAHDDDEKVTVQRFSLVSRAAPPATRAPVQRCILAPPPSLASRLGPRIQVCSCSECPVATTVHWMEEMMEVGQHATAPAPQRLCRQDTKTHPEYEMLLEMRQRFQAECASHADSASVDEFCCREKSAFFILGPDATVVGYVAAEVAANRRVLREKAEVLQRTLGSPAPSRPRDDDAERPHRDSAPLLLQVWVEPEFRRQGLASAALRLLLRGHDSLVVDGPTWPMVRVLEGLGFAPTGMQLGSSGLPRVTMLRREASVCI